MGGHASLKTCDVLGLGCVSVDDVLSLATYPAPDAKVPILHRQRRLGGQTGTALLAAARLGARAAYAGALGRNEASRFVLDGFRDGNVAVDQVAYNEDGGPIQTVVVIDRSTGTRTVFYELPSSGGADPAGPPAEVIRATKVLLVDQFGMAGMIRAANIARSAQVEVVADFESDQHADFPVLLDLVDHLIVGRDFASRRTGLSDPAACVQSLRTLTAAATVVVTGGAEGCWYLDAQPESTVVHQPAFAVRAVDTTGCGDVFHGAYAAALARGLPLKERIRFASAAAALKASNAGMPNLSAVERFLANTPEGTDGH